MLLIITVLFILKLSYKQSSYYYPYIQKIAIWYIKIHFKVCNIKYSNTQYYTLTG